MAPPTSYNVRTPARPLFRTVEDRGIPLYAADERSEISKNRLRESPGETIIREARDHLRAASCSNEAARAGAPARRRDDDGPHPARAAESDAGDRFPRQCLARPECSAVGRIPPGTERYRLCRRKKRSDRIPLGGGPLRSAARFSLGPRWPQCRRDHSDGRHPLGAGGEKRNLNDPDRLSRLTWSRPASSPLSRGQAGT